MMLYISKSSHESERIYKIFFSSHLSDKNIP